MSIAHKLVPAGIVAAFIGGIGYFVATTKGPCEVAIPYRIGTVDSRFGVTSAQLQKATAEAAALWGNAAHHPLFVYDPKAPFTVNLMFDWRQETTQTEISEVDRIKKLQAQLEALDADFLPRRTAFEKSAKDFNRQLALLNKRIDTFNGGKSNADDETRDAILRDQRALQERDRVLRRENDRINALVTRHNDLVTKINEGVDMLKHDALNGVIFEKGLYSRRGNTGRIDIFQFEDVAEMALTLAHEFGHALGLPHGSDPHSLMSPYLLSQKLVLSAEDLRMLKAYCSS